MADWHLKDLRNAMERSGWRFVAEHASENIYISASWEFERSGDGSNVFIEFEGIDDLRTLPILESYGCRLRGGSSPGLYFGRKGLKGSTRRDTWTAELKAFVASLNKSNEI